MAYQKKFYDGLMGVNSNLAQKYFILKFKLVGDDAIKIYGYQHCMAGFQHIMKPN